MGKHKEAKMEYTVEQICTCMETVLPWLQQEVGKGCQSCDTKELGEVADIVKDLAQAKKYLMEAAYYETVKEAMDKEEESYEKGDMMGYNHYRYASGRFAPKGSGTYMGYRQYHDQMPYIDAYLHDPNFKENMRMGYPEYLDDTHDDHESMKHMGYKWGDYDRMYPEVKYGTAYNEYKEARKHYTTTKSPQDKEKMNNATMDHIQRFASSMREMYMDADPDIKKRAYNDMMALANEMKP